MPTTVTEKMTIRVISGARIRRITMKMVAVACSSSSTWMRRRSRGGRSSSSSSPKICFQKICRTLVIPLALPGHLASSVAPKLAPNCSVLMIRSASLAHIASSPRRYRRWNETVSTTSRITETRFASRAPPDSDTTLAIDSAVTPWLDTFAA